MFDVDHDGLLSREEITEMVGALLEVWKDNRTDPLPVSNIWPYWTYDGHNVENDNCCSVCSLFVLTCPITTEFLPYTASVPLGNAQ